jgi:nucleoside-diphosphate-sugar epimerase
MRKIILVAGATGNIGLRIVRALVREGAEIRVLVRSNTPADKLAALQLPNVTIIELNQWSFKELKNACTDVACVVSALAGLREVIIDAQKLLLDAAIAAGVLRFIPSDYSLDFTKFKHGENRNLDWRREFHTYLNNLPIRSTSVFNGAFAELLTTDMPMILFKQKMILYWGNADYRWGFTTMDNTAAYTAKVALDPAAPRYLVIAGDQISPREVHAMMSELTGQKFRLFRPGGKGLLGAIIRITRKLAPGKNELYPAWQGMQYMHNMIDERSKIAKLHNDRYQGLQWTNVRTVISEHLK